MLARLHYNSGNLNVRVRLTCVNRTIRSMSASSIHELMKIGRKILGSAWSTIVI